MFLYWHFWRASIMCIAHIYWTEFQFQSIWSLNFIQTTVCTLSGLALTWTLHKTSWVYHLQKTQILRCHELREAFSRWAHWGHSARLQMMKLESRSYKNFKMSLVTSWLSWINSWYKTKWKPLTLVKILWMKWRNWINFALTFSLSKLERKTNCSDSWEELQWTLC